MKIFECRNITKTFNANKGLSSNIRFIKALDDVSFELYRSEVLGVIGESGSGKSTLAKIIAGLIGGYKGNLIFNKDFFSAGSFRDKRLRSEVQIVFQDPQASLNPRMKVGEAIAEPLCIRDKWPNSKLRFFAEEMLENVGLMASDYNRYPHEFSGGQCQRICIARALILKPKLLILDEPVSSLDLSVQAQILMLLKNIKTKFDMTYIFVSHDINVIEIFCDRLIVMHNGEIVEQASVAGICTNPSVEYTKNLIASVLSI
ncbi:MAG: ATP-binding cassette domain-containing protein [Candidatus Omnitrophica bacterium]|nr:ATP-binding cassette domain-containing protein [Candidatus Omnitrophota bacterium]